MAITIVGAGLAGLLAANLLRRHQPKVIERQGTIPNNHSAVLRFRTSVVGEALGIPFKKVSMIKATVGFSNPVADALAYSFKNLGTMRSDRSVKTELTNETRYIAPPDLITQMASGIDIKFNQDFKNDIPPFIVSTIPMPVLMQILKYPHTPIFAYIPGINIRAKIRNCDAYVSQIIPDPSVPFSRLSVTGDELILEVPLRGRLEQDDDAPSDFVNECIEHAARLLGIEIEWFFNIAATKSPYQKIAPIDDDERKQFIYWATDQHGIFSLGRFATWRPNLLLDDLVHDIALIDQWLYRTNRYAIARNRS